MGEVIGLDGDILTAQVYEETSGMRPWCASVSAPACRSRSSLVPACLTSIFDGVQRPLPVIEKRIGLVHRPWHAPDAAVPQAPLEIHAFRQGWRRRDRWCRSWAPCQRRIRSSTASWCRRRCRERLTWVAAAGEYTLEQPIARLKDGSKELELTMLQRWPVRRPRPYQCASWPEHAAHHRPTGAGHVLPGGQGRRGRHPGSIWFGQDGHAAQHRQVGRRPHHRLHRLRRTRQRDDRGACRSSRTSPIPGPAARSWSAPC